MRRKISSGEQYTDLDFSGDRPSSEADLGKRRNRTFRVLVAGGRLLIPTESAVLRVAERLREIEATSVISGGAEGGDRIGELAAKKIGIPVELFPADWSKHGNAAGPIRNECMVSSAPAHAILLPGSGGTADVRHRLLKSGVPITFMETNTVYPPTSTKGKQNDSK